MPIQEISKEEIRIEIRKHRMKRTETVEIGNRQENNDKDNRRDKETNSNAN